MVSEKGIERRRLSEWDCGIRGVEFLTRFLEFL